MRCTWLAYWGLRFVLLIQVSCSHAKTVDTRSVSQEKSFASPSSEKFEALLSVGAEEKIRNKLVDAGFLKMGDKTSIKSGLQRFQENNDLAKTGIPDHETVRRLGLNPEEIFLKTNP